MPYVPAPAGDDLTLLNNLLETSNTHVLVWGALGSRRVYGCPRSQRLARKRIKANPAALLVLYQRGPGGVWFRVDF